MVHESAGARNQNQRQPFPHHSSPCHLVNWPMDRCQIRSTIETASVCGLFAFGATVGGYVRANNRFKVSEFLLFVLRNLRKDFFWNRTLMTTMDDFEFDSTSFLEYLEPSFASLFTLLREAKECHTKVHKTKFFLFIFPLNFLIFELCRWTSCTLWAWWSTRWAFWWRTSTPRNWFNICRCFGTRAEITIC